jgi:hypothetical protein
LEGSGHSINETPSNIHLDYLRKTIDDLSNDSQGPGLVSNPDTFEYNLKLLPLESTCLVIILK